mmetsp:Transcript_8788/g.22955  ORF Transcript_8788/g.22955 Transcript_8788/m.22955 type:complete len:215 (+) Transcript_8788:168-812(+)
MGVHVHLSVRLMAGLSTVQTPSSVRCRWPDGRRRLLDVAAPGRQLWWVTSPLYPRALARGMRAPRPAPLTHRPPSPSGSRQIRADLGRDRARRARGRLSWRPGGHVPRREPCDRSRGPRRSRRRPVRVRPIAGRRPPCLCGHAASPRAPAAGACTPLTLPDRRLRRACLGGRRRATRRQARTCGWRSAARAGGWSLPARGAAARGTPARGCSAR